MRSPKKAFVMSLMLLCATQLHAQHYQQYCLQAGGQVEKMPAIFDTDMGEVKGNSKTFCTFAVDDGFLAIGLETFASSKPSIAATYGKMLNEVGEASLLWQGDYSNPSHNVCKNIGGSTIGFVLDGGFSNSFGETDICVFGDGSMISAWTLIYMANHRSGYDAIKNKIKALPLPVYITG